MNDNNDFHHRVILYLLVIVSLVLHLVDVLPW